MLDSRSLLLHLLSAQGCIGEVYNIGTQKERTVLDVARDICKIFNLPESKIVHVRDRAFNDRCVIPPLLSLGRRFAVWLYYA